MASCRLTVCTNWWY